MYRKLRVAIVAVTSAATFFAAPAQSHAIFHWFRGCCGSQPAPLAAPVVEAAPVVTPTVVNYVPQTCYRTQYVTVPMTTYRPATGCDPCTGCPVTTMRPVIAYVQQARLVPYTTYRAVLTSGSPCMPAYGAVGYAPSSSCSGCSAAPAAQPYYNAAPASPATISAPMGAAPIGAASPGAPTLAPGENPPTSSFRPLLVPSGPIISTGPAAAANGATTETRQKPIDMPKKSEAKSPTEGQTPANKSPEKNAETDAGSTSLAPKLINPGDRTTMRGDSAVRFAVHRIEVDAPAQDRSPVAWPRDTVARPAIAAIKPVQNRNQDVQPTKDDADGWRPSNR